MHLDCILRGSRRDMQRFIEELEGKYLPIKIKDKDAVCNVVVREIKLVEIIFPEEHAQKIIKTVSFGPFHKWERKFIYALRKILKLEKVPKIDDKTLIMPIYKDNLEIIPIGIKKDTHAEGYERL